MKNRIIEITSELGYNVNVEVVLAADYGVPQNRRRAIFVGVRNDIGERFDFRNLVRVERPVTVYDAIGDICYPERGITNAFLDYARDYDELRNHDVVFPNSKVTNLTNLNATVNDQKVDVSCTNQRYRLKGMFDGWFYYRDVYELPNGSYRDIPENESATFSPPAKLKLLQKFDEKIANDICDEINLQLKDAFKWLSRFKQKNSKKNKSIINILLGKKK